MKAGAKAPAFFRYSNRKRRTELLIAASFLAASFLANGEVDLLACSTDTDVNRIEVMRGCTHPSGHNEGVSDYRKLKVWRKAHALAINAHGVASRIRGQRYATFRNQIMRSAMSVPTNIVEGRAQRGEAGFARFLKIALASVTELEYHLLAARDIRAISPGDHLSLTSQLDEVRRMLHGLIQRLEQPRPRPSSRADGQPVVS